MSHVYFGEFAGIIQLLWQLTAQPLPFQEMA